MSAKRSQGNHGPCQGSPEPHAQIQTSETLPEFHPPLQAEPRLDSEVAQRECSGYCHSKSDHPNGCADGSDAVNGGCSCMVAAFGVASLSLCYGLGWTALFIQVATTTVAAKAWGGTVLSTIPYGILAASHALWAIPAQVLMRGRNPRLFYLLGALAGAAGNGIMVVGALRRSFALLCLGSPFCGVANAYVNFLRFEAARFVRLPRTLPVAISAVITGGVVGGALGPLISRFARHAVRGHDFMGTYVAAVGVWALACALVLGIPFHLTLPHAAVEAPAIPVQDGGSNPASTSSTAELGGASGAASEAKEVEVALVEGSRGQGLGAGGKEQRVRSPEQQQKVVLVGGAPGEGRAGRSALEPRGWRQLFQDPVFVVAVLAATFSYTFMATFMLTGVIAMTAVQPGTYSVDLSGPSNLAISFGDTSSVIIVHVEAMFVPSFFTGFIIRAVGADGAMLLGFLLIVLSEFLLLLSAELWVFLLTLALLGLGWNLAFVGATAALSTTYTAPEKDMAQGVNDAFLFGVNTAVTTTSSVLLMAMGSWPKFVLLYSCLSLPALGISLWFWLVHRRRRATLPALQILPPPKDHLQGVGSVTSKLRAIAR